MDITLDQISDNTYIEISINGEAFEFRPMTVKDYTLIMDQTPYNVLIDHVKKKERLQELMDNTTPEALSKLFNHFLSITSDYQADEVRDMN